MELVKIILEKKIIREHLSCQIPTNIIKLQCFEKHGTKLTTYLKRKSSEAISDGYRNLMYDKDDLPVSEKNKLFS